jgi:hypothetical protein
MSPTDLEQALDWFCQKVGTTAPASVAELVCALAALRSGSATSLYVALGIDPGWRQTWAIDRRNTLMVDYPARFYGGSSPHSASKGVEADLGSYHAAGWARDRTKPANPYPATNKRHLLFAILEYVDRPLSARHVREIVGSAEALPTANNLADASPNTDGEGPSK